MIYVFWCSGLVVVCLVRCRFCVQKYMFLSYLERDNETDLNLFLRYKFLSLPALCSRNCVG